MSLALLTVASVSAVLTGAILRFERRAAEHAARVKRSSRASTAYALSGGAR